MMKYTNSAKIQIPKNDRRMNKILNNSNHNTQFKSINSSALSFLYSPNLPAIHDYWINHSFD